MDSPFFSRLLLWLCFLGSLVGSHNLNGAPHYLVACNKKWSSSKGCRARFPPRPCSSSACLPRGAPLPPGRAHSRLLFSQERWQTIVLHQSQAARLCLPSRCCGVSAPPFRYSPL